MADIEKLLKAMECSLRPCRKRDNCKECKYRLLEKVDGRIPCPPDVEEDGIEYWESCDCDGMVKDAIETIRELQELTKGLSETHTSNPMYELGYKKGATDMEKAKQIIIDKLQEQLEKARAHLDFNYKSGFEQGKKEATKWHLCSEGDLPKTVKINNNMEASKRVLVVPKSFIDVGYDSCEIAQYINGKFMFGGIIPVEDEVIAWRELPKFEEVE